MILFILFAVVVGLITYYFYHTFTYWERRQIPSYPSPSLITGHVKSKFIYQLRSFYSYFKTKGFKHGGFYLFQQPFYMPIDPDLLKHIMVIDFEHFNEKGTYINETDQPIQRNLFHLGGDRWRKLRVKLTPTFTSGKLKHMYPTILNCSISLVQCLEEHSSSKTIVDIKEIASKFTTDVIGSCAFGIECNSFKDTRSDFHKMGKSLFEPTMRKIIRKTVTMSFPKLSRFLRLLSLDRDLEYFYTSITNDTVKYRKDNNIQRNDFLQLLISLQEKENPDERIDMQDIINQSFLFYVANFEISSSVMSFTLLELARNQDIQDKLRCEINQIIKKHNNEITYDAINEMTYLSQVVDETLRMYPPAAVLTRACSKKYIIPGTDKVLEKGTQVFIPLYAIQHDEEFYPNPEKFDPERFSEENRANRHPYTYMPFGEGSRMCIGLRFGYLQTKIGLVTLLQKFKFSLHPSVQYPIKIAKGIAVLQAEDKILLNSFPVQGL